MQEIQHDTDVLIVGAGPVGLSAAAALRQRGRDVTIVDRATMPATTSRAAVIHAGTLERLGEIDVTDELVRRGIKVPRFTVRDGDRALLQVDFAGLPSAHPYTIMLSQEETEKVLTSRLGDLGGSVTRGSELDRIEQDRAGVTAVMADGQEIRARYLVGADGMHSAVREQCGIGFAGSAYEESFVLADVRLDWEFDDAEVMLYFAPAGLVVIAPLPEGRYRIVATADSAPEHPDREFIQDILDERGPRKQRAVVEEIVWSSRFRVHHRLAERYREGRVFLAGDAAHVHSPAGGQGMNTGIQDALWLAETLDRALGGAGQAALDGYEAERRPVAAGVLSLTHRMTVAATLGNSTLRSVRNAILDLASRIPGFGQRMALNLSGLALRGPR